MCSYRTCVLRATIWVVQQAAQCRSRRTSLIVWFACSWAADRLDSRPGSHEVYVAARPFTAFGGDLMQRLSPEAKSLLVDAGICHFMFILRDPRGKLTMFDFGPIGGDVHVGIPAGGADAPKQGKPSKRKSKSVQGEIRITQVC